MAQPATGMARSRTDRQGSGRERPRKLQLVLELGVLELQLTKPSKLSIASGGGDRLQLTNAEGAMTLSLVQPLTITIDPPPVEQDQVLWNGAVLRPQAKKPGSYSMPNTTEAPERERPQTPPLSP